MGGSIELRVFFRFPVWCGLGLLLCRIGELQALLSGALAGLNFWVVCGKSLAFEKLCLARTGRIALMIRGRLLHRTHADVSSLQLHGGVCNPQIVQQQFYQENPRLGKGNPFMVTIMLTIVSRSGP
jgi:hypothetical protein